MERLFSLCSTPLQRICSITSTREEEDAAFRSSIIIKVAKANAKMAYVAIRLRQPSPFRQQINAIENTSAKQMRGSMLGGGGESACTFPPSEVVQGFGELAICLMVNSNR